VERFPSAPIGRKAKLVAAAHRSRIRRVALRSAIVPRQRMLRPTIRALGRARSRLPGSGAHLTTVRPSRRMGVAHRERRGVGPAQPAAHVRRWRHLRCPSPRPPAGGWATRGARGRCARRRPSSAARAMGRTAV
jgi:hypothetical protein